MPIGVPGAYPVRFTDGKCVIAGPGGEILKTEVRGVVGREPVAIAFPGKKRAGKAAASFEDQVGTGDVGVTERHMVRVVGTDKTLSFTVGDVSQSVIGQRVPPE